MVPLLTDVTDEMKVEEIAEVAVLMATLPPHMNMLEAIVLRVKQAYLGRGGVCVITQPSPPLGERVARGGVFNSRRGTGKGV